MHPGLPAHWLSHTVLHSEAAPVLPPSATNAAVGRHNPSDACSQTCSTFWFCSSAAAFGHDSGTPMGQSTPLHTHSRSIGAAAPRRKPQPGRTPGSTSTPGQAVICSQSKIPPAGSVQFVPETELGAPSAVVAPDAAAAAALPPSEPDVNCKHPTRDNPTNAPIAQRIDSRMARSSISVNFFVAFTPRSDPRSALDALPCHIAP